MKKNEKFCLAEALRPPVPRLKRSKYLKLIVSGVTSKTKIGKSEKRKNVNVNKGLSKLIWPHSIISSNEQYLRITQHE